MAEGRGLQAMQPELATRRPHDRTHHGGGQAAPVERPVDPVAEVRALEGAAHEARERGSADDGAGARIDEHERHGCPGSGALQLGVHVGRLALGGEERLAAERLPRGEVLPVPAIRDGEGGRVGRVERAEQEVIGDESGLDHPIDGTGRVQVTAVG